MKKGFWKRTLALVFVVCIMLTLTACSKLSGTYKSTGAVEQTLTFDGEKVIVSAFGLDIEGTYEIEKDTITITYSVMNLSYDMPLSFRKDGKSIFIEGEEFIKQ